MNLVNLFSASVMIRTDDGGFNALKPLACHPLQNGDVFVLGNVSIEYSVRDNYLKSEHETETVYGLTTANNEDNSIEIPPTEEIDDILEMDREFLIDSEPFSEEQVEVNKGDHIDGILQGLENAVSSSSIQEESVSQSSAVAITSDDQAGASTKLTSFEASVMAEVDENFSINHDRHNLEEHELPPTQPFVLPVATRSFLKRQAENKPRTTTLSAFDDTQDFGEPAVKKGCFMAETEPIPFESNDIFNTQPAAEEIDSPMESPPLREHSTQTQSQNRILHTDDEDDDDTDIDEGVEYDSSKLSFSNFDYNFFNVNLFLCRIGKSSNYSITRNSISTS